MKLLRGLTLALVVSCGTPTTPTNDAGRTGSTCARCAMPPAASCQPNGVLRYYDAPGFCADDAGPCDYAVHEVRCMKGCEANQCTGEPCLGKVCLSPPTPDCASSSQVRTYAQIGTCNAGQCSYAPVFVSCVGLEVCRVGPAGAACLAPSAGGGAGGGSGGGSVATGGGSGQGGGMGGGGEVGGSGGSGGSGGGATGGGIGGGATGGGVGGGAPPCGPIACPTGCCNNGNCEFGTTSAHCGTRGVTCSTCGSSEVCRGDQTCGFDTTTNWQVAPVSAHVTSNNWDVFDSPDPYVEMFCPATSSSKTNTTAVADNTQDPVWNSGACIMSATTLTTVGFAWQMRDSDTLSDDTILSKRTQVLTPAQLSAGTLMLGPLPSASDNQVSTMTFRLTRQ